MIGRITTFAIYQSFLRDTQKSMQNMQDSSQKISTGIAFDSYSELAATGQVQNLLTVNSGISQIDSFTRNNNYIKQEIDLKSSTIKNIYDEIADLQTTLVSRKTLAGSLIPLDNIIDDKLSSIQGLLNTSFNNKFLFAGSSFNTQPVSDLRNLDFIQDIEGNKSIDNSYYHGDDYIVRNNVSPELTIFHGITADDPTFRDIITALQIAKDAHKTNNMDELGSVIDMLNKTQSELLDKKVSLDNKSITISNILNNSDNKKNFLTTQKEEIQNSDTVLESINTNKYQATLQASFATFAKLSQLSILTYMK